MTNLETRAVEEIKNLLINCQCLIGEIKLEQDIYQKNYKIEKLNETITNIYSWCSSILDNGK